MNERPPYTPSSLYPKHRKKEKLAQRFTLNILVDSSTTML
jgi:hypothetical protein